MAIEIKRVHRCQLRCKAMQLRSCLAWRIGVDGAVDDILVPVSDAAGAGPVETRSVAAQLLLRALEPPRLARASAPSNSPSRREGCARCGNPPGHQKDYNNARQNRPDAGAETRSPWVSRTLGARESGGSALLNSWETGRSRRGSSRKSIGVSHLQGAIPGGAAGRRMARAAATRGGARVRVAKDHKAASSAASQAEPKAAANAKAAGVAWLTTSAPGLPLP